MTRASDICPECGAEPFKTQNYDKVVKERDESNRWYKKISADHGLEKAEWRIKEIELTETIKHTQRKTVKQAKVIQKLEDKLRRLKQRPYEEEEESYVES